ncbi:MAG: phosphatidylinositol kinase [Chthoniobacterales bacterium]|nr:phosphatidylinositol kinase [Chthoniobacterales bacterium]
MRKAEVLLHGRAVGILEELERGYRFNYRADYLENPKAEPVSLSLPLRREPFEDKRLFPFFDGLIPEGWLLQIAEATWKIDPRDRMGLLLACCRDCIGAAGVVPINAETGDE